MIKYFKNYNKDVLSWDEIINELWKAVDENQHVKQNLPAFFVTHEAHKMKKVKSILKKLKLKYAHLYISLTKNSESFGRHCDEDDVYFLLQQGKTQWNFDDGTSIILNPGDLIYVPKKIYHEVISLTPRAGLSMSA